MQIIFIISQAVILPNFLKNVILILFMMVLSGGHDGLRNMVNKADKYIRLKIGDFSILPVPFKRDAKSRAAYQCDS